MKKSIVIMFFLVFVILCISPKVNMFTVKADYIEKDNESYQYEFVCEITDIIETKQFKGEGTNIPYTYYSARVIDKIKGELETNIVIKFYGGYDESNNLILMENMNYLKVNDCYYIFADKSKAFDNRYVEDALVISSPTQYYDINNFQYLNRETPKANKIRRPIEEIYFEGGGGYANTSFSTAINMSLGNKAKINFTNVITKRYYKFSVDYKTYISIYTTGNYDSEIQLYSNKEQLIESNDNVYSEHGLNMTAGNNAFINYLVEPNTTYYFSISANISNSNNTLMVHLIEDNWSESEVNDLIWEEILGISTTIDMDDYLSQYNNNSKYISEIDKAISEWNSLKFVTFYEDNLSTLPNFTIFDFYDADTSVVADTAQFFVHTTIRLNDYYFENMNYLERVKTIMHELGHVLCLDEFTNIESTANVMHQGIRQYVQFGPADLAAYYYLWRH